MNNLARNTPPVLPNAGYIPRGGGRPRPPGGARENIPTPRMAPHRKFAPEDLDYVRKLAEEDDEFMFELERMLGDIKMRKNASQPR